MEPREVTHRSIVVNVFPSNGNRAVISVIARTARVGWRRDGLLWRGHVDDADFRDIRASLRSAAAAVSKAADSL